MLVHKFRNFINFFFLAELRHFRFDFALQKVFHGREKEDARHTVTVPGVLTFLRISEPINLRGGPY